MYNHDTKQFTLRNEWGYFNWIVDSLGLDYRNFLGMSDFELDQWIIRVVMMPTKERDLKTTGYNEQSPKEQKAIIRAMDEGYGTDKPLVMEYMRKWMQTLADEAALLQVMTASEVAEEYGLSESTVRTAITRGAFEGITRKSGGTWIVLRKDAQARWGKAVPKVASPTNTTNATS